MILIYGFDQHETDTAKTNSNKILVHILLLLQFLMCLNKLDEYHFLTKGFQILNSCIYFVIPFMTMKLFCLCVRYWALLLLCEHVHMILLMIKLKICYHSISFPKNML